MSVHEGRPAPAGLAESLGSPLRALATLGAVATGFVALWLFFVVVAVLPVRDPRHVPMWAGIATAFLGYAVLTLVFVARRARPAWLVAIVCLGSVAAIAFGGHEIDTVIKDVRAGVAFEGYLLLMGAVLVAHGACTLAYTAVTRAVRPS